MFSLVYQFCFFIIISHGIHLMYRLINVPEDLISRKSVLPAVPVQFVFFIWTYRYPTSLVANMVFMLSFKPIITSINVCYSLYMLSNTLAEGSWYCSNRRFMNLSLCVDMSSMNTIIFQNNRLCSLLVIHAMKYCLSLSHVCTHLTN